MDLNNLNNETPIAIIRYVKEKLVAQNKKSIHSDEYGIYCAYRGDDGCKCAIGHLLPDEHYARHYDEDGGLYFNILQFFNELQLSHVKIMLFNRLRIIHDSSSVKEWPQKFDELEQEYMLEATNTELV